jgi:hypothetical protein
MYTSFYILYWYSVFCILYLYSVACCEFYLRELSAPLGDIKIVVGEGGGCVHVLGVGGRDPSNITGEGGGGVDR